MLHFVKPIVNFHVPAPLQEGLKRRLPLPAGIALAPRGGPDCGKHEAPRGTWCAASGVQPEPTVAQLLDAPQLDPHRNGLLKKCVAQQSSPANGGPRSDRAPEPLRRLPRDVVDLVEWVVRVQNGGHAEGVRLIPKYLWPGR